MNGRRVAYLNGIKELTTGEFDPIIVKNHCLRTKQLWIEGEKEIDNLLPALLFINGQLAMAYESLQEYQKAIDLRADFFEHRSYIDKKLYFEYLGFLKSLPANYNALHLYDESLAVSTEAHLALESFLKNYGNSMDQSTKELVRGLNLQFILDLATAYEGKGEVDNAEVLYRLSIDRANDYGIIDHLFYSGLISLYSKLGKYDKMSALLEESTNNIKLKYGQNSEQYAFLLLNHVQLWQELGDFNKAKSLILEAIPLVETTKDRVAIEASRQVLASVYEELQEYDSLQILYNETIKKHIQYYGKESIKLCRILLDYSTVSEITDVNKSIALANEARKIAIKNNDNLMLIECEQHLAGYYSRKYLKQAISGFEDKKVADSAVTASDNGMMLLEKFPSITPAKFIFYTSQHSGVLSIIGRQKEALAALKSIEDKKQYFDIDDRLNYFRSLGSLYSSLQKFDSSFIYFEEMSRLIKKDVTERNFQLVESGFENYYSLSSRFADLDGTIYRHYKEEPRFIELGANNAIFRKSLLLNSAEVLRRTQNKAEQRDQLRTEKNSLFKEENWQVIQKSLRPKSALIEFISYESSIDSLVMYYAIIIFPTGKPKILTFDQAGWQVNNIDGNVLDKLYEYGEKSYYELIWSHFSNLFEGIKEIIISPDAYLNNINFAAIQLPDKSFLGEKFSIRRITSSRFLSTINDENQIKSISLFGGIDYNLTDNSDSKYTTGAAFNVRNGSSKGGKWTYLPGTYIECMKIDSLSKDKRIGSNYYKGQEATEGRFKELQNQETNFILHVATHGYYIAVLNKELSKARGVTIKNKKQNTKFIDPLHRTAIVFAGANNNSSNQITRDTLDGLATGFEISRMNLDKCKLAVLSACETGLGDIKGKEGVFGLQRAFKLAGVNKMIISLWQIPDEQTAELFIIFYKKLFEIGSITEALRYAQLQMSKKYSPYYWAGFILLE